MSVVSLLLGLPQKGTSISRDLKSGNTATIFLDATVRENFTAPTEVTQHPVEKGADISDHIVLKPQKLMIDGVISETPFSIEGQAAGLAASVAASVGQQLGGAFGGLTAGIGVAKSLAGVLKPKSIVTETTEDGDTTTREIPSQNSRLRDAVNEFTNIRDAKQLITIVTGLRQYKNFVLMSFNVSRDQQSGQSINVSLEFQEILVAESKTVKVAIPKIKAALPKSEQGRKQASTVSDTSRKGSILKQLFGD